MANELWIGNPDADRNFFIKNTNFFILKKEKKKELESSCLNSFSTWHRGPVPAEDNPHYNSLSSSIDYHRNRDD